MCWNFSYRSNPGLEALSKVCVQTPNLLENQWITCIPKNPSNLIRIFLVFALIVAIQMTEFVNGMGLCFGGYPACCQGGKNTCGPFCASCSRVGEFLMNMMMFDPRGFGRGTPNVFRLINPDPHAFPEKDPFPAKPFPTNPWSVGQANIVLLIQLQAAAGVRYVRQLE